MNDMWIARMGVDRLLNGRNQPFYNVLVEDGSNRYAAEGSSGLEKISTYQIFYAPEFSLILSYSSFKFYSNYLRACAK